MAFLFNEGATVVSYVMKLIHGNSVPRDIHRPRMPAAHDGLSKAQGCLWYPLANWEEKMLRPNRSCGP